MFLLLVALAMQSTEIVGSLPPSLHPFSQWLKTEKKFGEVWGESLWIGF